MQFEFHPKSESGSRRRLPPWLQAPSTSPFHQRVASIIETEEYAEELRECRKKRLIDLAPHIQAKLEACSETKGGCQKPNCPCCARLFRLWRSSEAQRLFMSWNGNEDRFILNLILREVAVGELSTVDLKSELAKLRVYLARSIGHGTFLIGGIEVALRRGTWSLHMHAVAFGSAKQLRPKLVEHDVAPKFYPILSSFPGSGLP